MADEWVWLCRSCVFREDERYVVGSVARDSICARCGGLAMEVFLVACQDPRRAVTPGSYPAGMEFTPSTIIDRYRVVVWDANGYYADLGVPTDATKNDLMHAYQALRGHESERLTYVVKQLLNLTIRTRYDATPMGSVFFDHYIAARVKQRIIEQVTAARQQAGEEDDASLFEDIDVEAMVNERSFEVVDTHGQMSENGIGWGYYLWQSNRRHGHAQWISELSQAFSEQGDITRIAVGFHHHLRVPVAVTRWDNRTIVWLDDREVPSIELAREAVSLVRTESGPQHQRDPDGSSLRRRFANEQHTVCLP